MASYLTLGSWTEQGIQNVKESPQRVEAARSAIEAAGGHLVFFYMTMGQYDFAALVETDGDEAAAKLLLNLARQGNIRTETVRAFTEEEHTSIIDSL
jgi:uncharacterized protein with GYD domain